MITQNLAFFLPNLEYMDFFSQETNLLWFNVSTTAGDEKTATTRKTQGSSARARTIHVTVSRIALWDITSTGPTVRAASVARIARNVSIRRSTARAAKMANS